MAVFMLQLAALGVCPAGAEAVPAASKSMQDHCKSDMPMMSVNHLSQGCAHCGLPDIMNAVGMVKPVSGHAALVMVLNHAIPWPDGPAIAVRQESILIHGPPRSSSLLYSTTLRIRR